MTLTYYIVVALMWVCLFLMVRHTCTVVNNYGRRCGACSRTVRMAQFTGVFGLFVVGTGATYAASVVLALHTLSVSGVH
ncbi:hypothetical protein STRATTON_281 [Erwinia phage vB_EamM_Stratton]|uniref:Uncharacterized protein n=1 Tax=Erwinia phage vB_EamM_Stratton TaxID=1883378 RepID=A0A1B2IHG1_9CAUD|nr:hypothetical protein STRATTON_281 [Erwinia phage vB_EamM_Stratton]